MTHYTFRPRLNVVAYRMMISLLILLSFNSQAHDGESYSKSHIVKAAVAPSHEAEIKRARNYFTDLQLVTQEGKKVRFYSDVLDDKVVLINVMYTKCKDACPLLTKHLVSTKEQLGTAFGEKIFFVSISNDPDRDSPESLVKFAKKQKADHPGWKFLTGDKNNINTIINKLGLYSKNIEEHTTMLIIGNTRTRHWVKLQPNIPPEAIAIKLQELAKEG